MLAFSRTAIRSHLLVGVVAILAVLSAGFLYPRSDTEAAGTPGSPHRQPVEEIGHVSPPPIPAPEPKPGDPGPRLSNAKIQSDILTATARCEGEGTVKVYSPDRLVGTQHILCGDDGHAEVRIKLARPLLDGGAGQGEFQLAVMVEDETGAASYGVTP